MNFLAAFLIVEGENRNPSAIKGPVVHLGPCVLWMADPRIEVRQVEDQQSPAPQMAAEDGECPSDIRWGCDVVEGRPEAEQGVEFAGQVEGPHIRFVEVHVPSDRLQRAAGDAEHVLGSIPTHHLVPAPHQREVQREAATCDIEDLVDGAVPQEEMLEEWVGSRGPRPIVQLVVIRRDRPIPAIVGVLSFTSQEPHVR